MVASASSFTGRTGTTRTKHCSRISHARVGAADAAVGGSRLSGSPSRWGLQVQKAEVAGRVERGVPGMLGVLGVRMDLRDKGVAGGAASSTLLFHSVATRTRVPGMVPNP